MVGPQRGALAILAGLALGAFGQWFFDYNVLSEDMVFDGISRRLVTEYRNPDLRFLHRSIFVFWLPLAMVGIGLSQLDLREGPWSRAEAGVEVVRAKNRGLAFIGCGVIVCAGAVWFANWNSVHEVGSQSVYRYPSLKLLHSPLFTLFVPAGLGWSGWHKIAETLQIRRRLQEECEHEIAELNNLRFMLAVGPQLDDDELARLVLLQTKHDPRIRPRRKWSAYDPYELARLREDYENGVDLDPDSLADLDELEERETLFLAELEQHGLNLRELSDLRFEVACGRELDEESTWRLQLLHEARRQCSLGLMDGFPIVGLDVPGGDL